MREQKSIRYQERACGLDNIFIWWQTDLKKKKKKYKSKKPKVNRDKRNVEQLKQSYTVATKLSSICV